MQSRPDERIPHSLTRLTRSRRLRPAQQDGAYGTITISRCVSLPDFQVPIAEVRVRCGAITLRLPSLRLPIYLDVVTTLDSEL